MDAFHALGGLLGLYFVFTVMRLWWNLKIIFFVRIFSCILRNSYKSLFSSQTHCAVQTSYDKNHINIHFKQTLNIVVYHNRPSNNNHVTHTRTHTEGLDCQVRTFMFSCSNVVPSRLSSLHTFQDSDSFSAVRVPYRAANTPAVGRCRLCFGVPSLSL